MLYVLDEPSIGLHQRDNDRLLGTLKHLRDLGNTVIVVEHDEDTIAAADHLVDFGPGAGVHGGRIVAQGTPDDIIADARSRSPGSTSRARGDPDAGRRGASARRARRSRSSARARTTSRTSTREIPLGLFICVTGVTGSGKTSLIIDTLYAAVARKLNNARRSRARTTASRGWTTSTR